VLHLAVPDEREAICDALDFASLRTEWIFTTGGLGPTSDDITREIVAEWTQLPLYFDDGAWDHLAERLRSRGREAKDIHRKQAQFPRGSLIFPNRQGTACGFAIASTTKWKGQLIVLPGPPKEIDAIWTDHLQEYLRSRIPAKNIFLYTWLCEGRGESEFAEITERIFAESGLRIGYRLIDRRTEVKVWVPKNLETHALPLREQLTAALGSSLVERAGPL
jgi:nicotinamide-nucleotide amidase